MTIARIGKSSDATWARAWEVADAAELATLLATWTSTGGPKRGDIIVQLDIGVIFLLVSANLVEQVSNLARLQGSNTFTDLDAIDLQRAGTVRIGLRNTSAGADLKQWYVRVSGVVFQLQTVDDAGSGSVILIESDRNGNLALTGTIASFAGQIGFPATQNPSAGANVLDDYEEGSWTMTIGGDGGTSGQTYSTRVGRYQKIGRKVEIWGVAQLSNKGTITGNVEIQGLPFPCTNSDGTFRSPCAFNFFDLATNQISVQGTTIQNTSTVIVRALAAAATAMGNVLTTADITNTTALSFTTSYLTDN